MANDARHTPSDLKQIDTAGVDFFRLLTLLERDGKRFGRAGGPEREPARLGQSPRMGFATQDVASLSERAGHPEVAVNVLGLLGPEGPMPLHLTRWVMERLSNRWFAGDDATALADTSFLDLANMLQHRMLALYWRAWADARPEIHIAHDDGSRVTAMLRAMAGIGLPGTRHDKIGVDNAKLRHATSLVDERHSPERLTAYLETVIGVPVSLREFSGVWLDIPSDLQTRLGQVHAGLGTGAVVGSRSFDRLSQAELQIGPLSLEQFTAVLEDPDLWDDLCHAVIFAAGKEMAYTLRLILRAEDVPAAQLGQCQLGRTTWLNPIPGVDADDLSFLAINTSPTERTAA